MLNAALYQTLVRRFGDVRIANENEPMEATYSTDARTGRPKFKAESMGESFRVNCPFCHDQRHRLWINHRWAARDRQTMERYMFLAKCFNEDCIADKGWRELEHYIFGKGGVCLGMAAGVTAPPEGLREAQLPGPVRILSDLPYGHHACAYLRQRGFDVEELASVFGVGYCAMSSNRVYARASNRIIIPAYHESVLVGWQARFIGDRDWHNKEFYIPKYFSMPSFKKSQTLYNIDQASKDPNFVVLCEGPSDVWRVGPSSVAMFGKSIGPYQVKLVEKYWSNGHVVVMLDREATHDAAKVALQLAGKVKKLYVLPPPKGFEDPGDAPRSVLWDHIKTEVLNESICRV